MNRHRQPVSRPRTRSNRWLAIALSATAFLLAVCGCREKPSGKPPPAMLTVSRPLREMVVEWDEYPGHLESPKVVNVAARVNGVIESAPFDEGSLIREGEPFFLIDPRPFEAELLSKEADVRGAESALAQASAQFARYEKLKGTRAISAQDYDVALANLQQARAQVGVAKAARDIAALNLEWTRVSAPISGKIGRKLVTEGNQISGGGREATTLTVITSIDPIYCYVTVPEQAYLEYRERFSAGIPAWAKLENEEGFRHGGKIDFVDNRVDSSTGTVIFRAVLPNSSGELTPGLFATLRIPGSEPYEAILVPDAAIGTSQDSRFVLVVGDEGAVEQRTVKLGALFGPLRAISEGIGAEELIVTKGLLRARAGEKAETSYEAIAPDALAEYRPALSEGGIAVR